MMADRRETLVENLAVAAAVGVLVLLVAALSLVAHSRATAQEGSSLAAACSGSSPQLVLEVDDPAFERIFSLRKDSGNLYGTIVSLRRGGASALVGALYSPQGDLRELHIVDSFGDRLSGDERELVSSFPGAERVLDRAADSIRGAVRKGE
jgi:hypothetical protein